MGPESYNHHEWIDVSVPLSNDTITWQGDHPVRVERTDDIERGDSYSLSALCLSSHSGTHIDAPAHFLRNGETVDKIPMERFVGAARVVEIADTESIKPQELKNHRIRKGDRILFKTRNSGLWHERKTFTEDYVYVTLGAASYLAQIGVVMVGIDYLSVGSTTQEGVEVHRVLLESGIIIVEGLDLSKTGAGRFDLICLPLKIHNGDGAPARVILRPRRRG
ncbi:cyclase family protein [Dehalogenimonas etheniformans]|uniref:Kynurenine formamidase n=1 Tax=Dehalogenimonas etheniformans TaxID=1536648 RepID=A0A2P5P5Y5_9CHLR|nr:cyclase family protein [Dehalogenimonas etheniformans]PPD57713.1 cyclase family protein [Dehalogenimonas etheniformans]QNT76052.1 cyclase family protein [Dehalogenimonas etheniformans]